MKDEFKSSNSTLSARVTEMNKSASFINEIFEVAQKKLTEVLDKNIELLKANAELSQWVNDLKQYLRMNNVEIKGVPISMGEDCTKTIQSVGDATELKTDVYDIGSVHWGPSFNMATGKNNSPFYA